VTKPRVSAEPPPAEKRPEFFLDRCLGKIVAEHLRGNGWPLHVVAEEFPDDGQDATDEEWITFGLMNGWALLTQDKRIRYRAAELVALSDGHGVMFCLSNGNLLIADRIARFETAREKIVRAATAASPALYFVYDNDIRLKWP
jgi:hypothetical protein